MEFIVLSLLILLYTSAVCVDEITCGNDVVQNRALDEPESALSYVASLGVGFDVRAAEFPRDMRAHKLCNFNAYYKLGMRHVRIRIGMDVTDKTKDPGSNERRGDSLLKHLKQVVDDAIQVGMYPIIAYQGGEVEDSPTVANQKHFRKWWKKVFAAFKEYPTSLSFNLIVEVGNNLSTNKNVLLSLYRRSLFDVRKKQKDRVVFIAPTKLSEPTQLYELFKLLKKKDNFLAFEVHDYAAGPTKYEVDGETEIEEVELAFDRPRFWYEGIPADRNTETECIAAGKKTCATRAISVAERARNRQRIRETMSVIRRVREVFGKGLWIGAWMATNFNKNQFYKDGKDYSIEEQKLFGAFCAWMFCKNGLSHAWNADSKYFNVSGDNWYSDQKPVLDAIMASSACTDESQNPEKGMFVEHYKGPSEYTMEPDSARVRRVEFGEGGPVLLYTVEPEKKAVKTVNGKKETRHYGYLKFEMGNASITDLWFTGVDKTFKTIHDPRLTGEAMNKYAKRLRIIKYNNLKYARIVLIASDGASYAHEYKLARNTCRKKLCS